MRLKPVPSTFASRRFADQVVEAMRYNAGVAQTDQSLKGITAKRAKAILGLTGRPFWQEESYHHVVPDNKEFGKIWNYIEQNPVRVAPVG